VFGTAVVEIEEPDDGSPDDGGECATDPGDPLAEAEGALDDQPDDSHARQHEERVGAGQHRRAGDDGQHQRGPPRSVQHEPARQRQQQPHGQRGLETVARGEGDDPRRAHGEGTRPAGPTRDGDAVEHEPGLSDGEQAEEQRGQLQLEEVVPAGYEVGEHGHDQVQRAREALDVLSLVEDGPVTVDEVGRVAECDERVVRGAREGAADGREERQVQEERGVQERRMRLEVQIDVEMGDHGHVDHRCVRHLPEPPR